MNKKRIKDIRHVYIQSAMAIVALFLIFGILHAQQPPPQNPKRKIVQLKQADLLSKSKTSDAQVLKDNVVFYHEGAYMYCDSAYLFESKNIFEAFSNVRIEQGDTLFVYGDYLHYDGNTKLAALRDNVRMEDSRATLFTDSLNYDRAQNLGYYFDGGMLVDDENELTSFWGQYDPKTKEALFTDSVKLVNEKYTLYSDNLEYNTATKIADINGPATIVSDSGTIYTDKGWYNTVTEDSQLFNRSRVISRDGSKSLTGDTIYYNREKGFGTVHGNMFLQDTLRKVILLGNCGFYDDKKEFALATDSAQAIEYSQKDSLFLHGDTLTLQTDSIYREVKAYYDVRFYRTDLQGVCDSMQFVSKDSTLYLYRNPVLWHENYQIVGDQIDIFFNDTTIEEAKIRNYAFSTQKRNISGQFNQLKGRDMTITFVNGEMRNVLVEGNAESAYYIEEEDSTMVGLNKTESAYLSMSLRDRQLEKLKLWSASNAVTYPLSQLPPEEKNLKGFEWMDALRPKNRYDIFRKTPSRSSKSLPPPRRFVRE